MIVGLGIDIVEVARIERAMKKPGFVERILTQAELERRLTSQYVAGRWAAKEAVMKCLPQAISWQQVEIVSKAGCAPSVSIRNVTLDPSTRVLVSISHERGFAAAVAVVEAAE
jgi:holo-[acyl-carrier protein] synthase